jgi:hypothetical protein
LLLLAVVAVEILLAVAVAAGFVQVSQIRVVAEF